MNLNLVFNAKINSKWVTGLDLIMFLQFYNIIKLLGKNMGESIWCLGPGKEFLDLTPKAPLKKRKNDKFPGIKK